MEGAPEGGTSHQSVFPPAKRLCPPFRCVHFLHPQSTWGLGSRTRRAGAAAPLPWLQEGVAQQLLGTGSEAGIWFKSSKEEGLSLS